MGAQVSALVAHHASWWASHAYPAYATMQALKRDDPRLLRKWLCFWILHAPFMAMEYTLLGPQQWVHPDLCCCSSTDNRLSFQHRLAPYILTPSPCSDSAASADITRSSWSSWHGSSCHSSRFVGFVDARPMHSPHPPHPPLIHLCYVRSSHPFPRHLFRVLSGY